ncbi:MAG: flagellar biosynthesis protein FliQ [Alphaproteobacteria bacterium]|nr:flagellar biosynthesis protein FliQ [Alphaproteobacteria bacterium]
MTGAEALDIARISIWTLLLVAGPVMLVALAVGTFIGVMQALTQVQEATIVFVPKIIAVFLVLLLMMPFMAQQMSSYMTDIFTRIGTP